MSDSLTSEERKRVQDELQKAVSDNNHEAALAALTRGAHPAWRDEGQEDSRALFPPLHTAVKHNDTRMLDILLNWGADINERDTSGETAFMTACNLRKTEAGTLLLEAGANFRTGSSFGRTPQGVFAFRETEDEPLHDVLEEYTDRRPRIDSGHEPEKLKERLFRQNNWRFSPLDNPQTWQEFDSIGALLLEQKNPITKDEWFDLNGQGERWIDVAVKFRMVDKVLEHMKAQGERLTVDDLVQDPPLLENICRKGGAKQLFNREFLQHEGVAGMKRLQEHMPEDAKAEITNRFALKTWLNMHEQQQAQGQGR